MLLHKVFRFFEFAAVNFLHGLNVVVLTCFVASIFWSEKKNPTHIYICIFIDINTYYSGGHWKVMHQIKNIVCMSL